MRSSPAVPTIDAGRPKHLGSAAAEAGPGQPLDARTRAGNKASRIEILMLGGRMLGRSGTRVEFMHVR